MPSIRVSSAGPQGQVPAGGSLVNVLTGSAFEFAPDAEEIEVYATQVSGGGILVADVQFGSSVQMEQGPLADEIGAGQGPRIPDNLLVSDVAVPGDRLKVSLRETAGLAAGDWTVMVRTRPVV